MRVFSGRRLKLETLVFSPHGQHIACAGKPTDSAYDEIRVLDVAGDGLAKQRTGMVTGSVSFTPDGHFFIFPSRHLWYRMSMADGRLERDETLASLNPAEVCPNGRRALTCCVNAPTGLIAASIAEYCDHTWRTTWNRNIRYECHGRPETTAADTWEEFNEVRLAIDASRVMVRFNIADRDRPSVGSRILVVDAASGEPISDWRGTAYLTGHTGEISPDGRLLFWHSRTFQVIDPTASGCDPITRTNTSRKHFTAAAFSPDGKLLATTSNDTTVTMWDTATWQPIRQYGWEIGRLRAVAFAPDGLTCAAGSDTGKVVLFDVDG